MQIAYAIGVAEPASVYVDKFDTGRMPEQRIETAVRELFVISPGDIIATLARPIYRPTATYGHFGREQDPWEQSDRLDAIRRACHDGAARWARRTPPARAPDGLRAASTRALASVVPASTGTTLMCGGATAWPRLPSSKTTVGRTTINQRRIGSSACHVLCHALGEGTPWR